MNETIDLNFDKTLELKMSTDKEMQTVLPVTLFNNHVEIEIHQGLKKHISYSSFKEIINKSLNSVQAPQVITGLLPPSNMIFLSQTDNNLYINCYYSGCYRDMLYNTEKLHIVAPNIIIAFSLKRESGDWIITKTNYFCTDLSVSKLPKKFIDAVDHESGIYDLPMSNTYGGGSMCYGSNSMPARFKDGNLRGMDWYFRYLWETPFNNDLGIRAIGDKVSVKEWYHGLAKYAKEGKAFPYCDLAGYKTLDGSPKSESLIRARDL